MYLIDSFVNCAEKKGEKKFETFKNKRKNAYGYIRYFPHKLMIKMHAFV